LHFPEVPQLFYVWHVNKNVQTETSKLWRVKNASEEENMTNKEKRKEFMTKWEEASYELHSPTSHSIGCSGQLGASAIAKQQP
jgi:hypothetical protein